MTTISVKQSVEPVKDKVPIFIVGAGGVVHDGHIPAYMKAGFSIAGICDLKPGKAQAMVNDFPDVGTAYDSLELFLQSHKAEEIIYDVAVPADQIMNVLGEIPEGASVLIQKPMGETLREAKAIFQMCADKSFTAAVNLQMKYAPFSIAAKDLIERGAIGEVFDIEIMVCVYTPWHLWDFLKTKPRVEILYHSIHYIDLVRFLLGNPRRVYASTLKHPKTKELASTRTTMILDYDDLTQARIITNHGHDFGPQQQKSYMKIEGTKGAVLVVIGVSLDYPKGKPDRFSFVSDQTSGRWTDLELHGSWFPDAFIGPMAHLQHLHNSGNTDRLATLRDNFETMRVVEAAYRSSETGGLALSEVE